MEQEKNLQEILVTNQSLTSRDATAQLGEALGLDDQGVYDLFPDLKSDETKATISFTENGDLVVSNDETGVAYTYFPEEQRSAICKLGKLDLNLGGSMKKLEKLPENLQFKPFEFSVPEAKESEAMKEKLNREKALIGEDVELVPRFADRSMVKGKLVSVEIVGGGDIGYEVETPSGEKDRGGTSFNVKEVRLQNQSDQ